ncbi:MAG: hypothetical protein WA869_09525 [Alloacidobacterium sp.]
MKKLDQRGETIPEDAIAAISPYLTEHINRFGDYTLNLDRKPPQPYYGLTLNTDRLCPLRPKWPILSRSCGARHDRESLQYPLTAASPSDSVVEVA